LEPGLPDGYPEGEEQVLRLASAQGVHAAAHELWKNDDAGLQSTLRQRLASELGALAATVRRSGEGDRWLVGPLSAEGQPLSYPFGEARNAVQRPVLAELRAACLEAGVKLKVVGLWRDPLEATYSRVRQMRTALAAHALLQARIVDDNLRFVASDILSLPCALYPGGGAASAAVAATAWAATVRFEEDLEARPAWTASALAAFTGLDPAPLLQRARDAIHAPASTSTSGNAAMAMVMTSAAAWGLRDYFGYQDTFPANAPTMTAALPPPTVSAPWVVGSVAGPGSGLGSTPAGSAPLKLQGGGKGPRARSRRALLSFESAWAGIKASATGGSSASVGGTSSGFSSFGAPLSRATGAAPLRGGSRNAAFASPPPLTNATLQARGWWALLAPELHISHVVAADVAAKAAAAAAAAAAAEYADSTAAGSAVGAAGHVSDPASGHGEHDHAATPPSAQTGGDAAAGSAGLCCAADAP
jgi:hypothetical protein